MPKNDALHPLSCPSCNAPLEYDGVSPTIRCPFCSTLVAVPDSLRGEGEDLVAAREEHGAILDEIRTLLHAGNKTEAVRRYREIFDTSLTLARAEVERIEAEMNGLPAPLVEVFIPAAPLPAPVPKTTASGRMGCIITAAVLLFVGSIMVLVFLQPGGPFNPRMVAIGPAILAPGLEEGSTGFITEIYNSNKESDSIIRLDSSLKKPVWVADPFSDDTFLKGLAIDGGLVFAAPDANLLAYNYSDGSLAWQTLMTDSLNYDPHSLVALGGRVIALTLDQNLQAFDARTGRPAWSRQLQGYDRTLRIVGNRLLVLDYATEPYTYSLILLNPADGTQELVITPRCSESDDPASLSHADTIDTDSGIIYDSSQQALFLIYGDFYGCVQRYNLPGGEVAWQTRHAGGFYSGPNAITPVVTDGRLYFGYGNQLGAVDMTSGEFTLLQDVADTEFLPLALSGDRLVVRARERRGSESFALWGLDVFSGARLWTYSFGEDEPLDPPGEMSGLVDDTDSGWTWGLLPAGFAVIRFQGEPNQVVLETLDPQDGSLVSQVPLPLKFISGDFYSTPKPIAWQNGVLWLLLDGKVVALDVNNATITYRWQ